MNKQLLSDLNPNALLTWPVLTLTLAWGVVGNLIDRVFNSTGLYIERITSVTVGWLAMVLVIAVGVGLLKLLPIHVGSLAMIPLVVIACVARGYVVWLFLMQFKVDDVQDFSYRILGAISNMGLLTLFTAIAVQRIKSYSQVRSALLAETSRLTKLKDFAHAQMIENTEEQLRDIRATVRHALSLDTRSTVSETITAISSTIDEVVRPLTEVIESKTTELPKEEPVPSIRLDWREALIGSLSSRFLRPVPVALFLVLAGIVYVSTVHTPIETAAILTISSSCTWLLLTIVKSGLRRVESFAPAWVVRMLFLMGVIGSGFIVGLSALPITLQTATPLSTLFIAPNVVVGLSLLVALGASTQAQGQVANENLESLRSNLAWEVARISNEQMRLRKSVANLLHGTLQSGLTSALMKLRMAETSNQADLEETRRLVQGELTSLLDSVKLQDRQVGRSISEIVSSINGTWLGIAVIELEPIPKSLMKNLEADQVLIDNFAEIAVELSFNAIKHGAATQISFSITMRSDNTVELVSIDNGSRPSDSGRIGIGTKLLDESALEWKREAISDESGTKTTVLLTFSPTQTK